MKTNIRKTTREWVNKAKKVHGDVYDYSKVIYINAHTYVSILCRKHGVFIQSPATHANRGRGCPACGVLRRAKARADSTDSFIEKAKRVHPGGKYGYGLVKYCASQEHVLIECFTHGVFKQSPDNHLRGKGCPSCAVTGFDVNKSGFLYVLGSSDKKFLKIGISNTPTQRIKRLKKRTPFAFKALFIYESGGYVVQALEGFYMKNWATSELKGFEGCTEWVPYSSDKLAMIAGMFQALGTKDALALAERVNEEMVR